MTHKPETKLTYQIIGELRNHKYQEKLGWWFKVHGSSMQVSGIPDIIGVYRGTFIAFEVKVPGKETNTSRRQEAIMKRIRLAGGIAHVVTSPHEAMLTIRELDKLA